MTYDKFKYIYPPRPQYKIPAHDLSKYDTGQFVAQVKYNGSATVIFTNGDDLHIYNRHKELLSRPAQGIEFRKLALTKKWFVYAGEYLNKGKTGENGEKEKDKFVIWDILVWNGTHLIGETLLSRLSLLEEFLPCNRAVVSDKIELYDHLCCTDFKGIYKTPTYTNGFTDLYNDIVKTDLYEGLVLKKINSKLSFGFQPLNNHDWSLKCRKVTKLYNF